MLIYRVEDENGDGPYRHPNMNDVLEEMEDAHSWNERDAHPTPHDEGINVYDLHHKKGWDPAFAFSSLESLETWFGDWLKPLTEIGFVVRVYDVYDRRVIETPTQVVYDRKFAVRQEPVPC